MLLGVLLEVVLIGILVIGSYYGFKMGFFSIAIKPIKILFGITFALSLCNMFGTHIVAPIIQAPLTNYIKEFMYNNCATLSPENVVEEMPTLLKMAGAAFNVQLADMSLMTIDSVIENIIINLTSPAVSMISIGISFLLLFFSSKLIFSWGILVINSAFNVGILGKINKVMGFVLAGALARIVAWAFVGIVDFLFHLSAFDGVEIIRSFRGGLIYRIFNSFNPIELLLSF